MAKDLTEARDLVREPLHFASRVTADARDGWPVEAGRYRLVVSWACPWAHRVVITRRLLGLERAISLAVVDPVQEVIEGDYHWVFTEGTGSPGGLDPVLGIHSLREAYLAAEPDYTGGVSVPGLVDIPSGHLVSNDFARLTLDLGSQWTSLHRPGAPELYPEPLRPEIDTLVEQIYRDVNNAVYRAGFAPRQEFYDSAVTALFDRLDALEERLTTRRYLVGDSITEADVRLWPTLVRFDAVYHGHFDDIRNHYYRVHDVINPTRIVARGPDPAGFLAAHGRERLGGSPFGAGTAPGPSPEPVPSVTPA
jgi:putative glutathione S-transferase